MTRKYLNLDQSSAAACLSPVELAKESQACHIYNPAVSKYVSVATSSPVLKDQDSQFVDTDSDIRGHGKHFKLKECDEGGYNIIALNEEGEEDGFLYLSDKVQSGMLHRCSNILKSSNMIQDKHQQYKFEILESDFQCGLYRIVCCGKMLFASKGAHAYLLADSKDVESSDAAWFQFNLKARVVKKEGTGDEICYNSFKDTTESSFYYDNNSSEAVKVKFSLKDKKFINMEQHSTDDDSDILFPENPFIVEAKSKLILQLISTLTTFTKLKKTRIETENGKAFLGFVEQKCFHNKREWNF